MKYILILFLLICNFCIGQYTEAQYIEADTTKVPMSIVRGFKKALNGDILIASYLGVFRYDGKTFTVLKKQR